MPHDDNHHPDLPVSIPSYLEREPHMVAVLDWFVLEGAHHDEARFGGEVIDALTLDDIDYYYSDPTKDFDHYIVEIVALASIGAPFDIDTVHELVAPIASTLEGHDLEIEVDDQCDGIIVWVVCRLTPDELDPGAAGRRLTPFIALAKQVRDRVGS